MKAAIYARYSSDLQSESSIEDQIALCREYAARERLAVTATFSDRARSGSSIFGRDGLMDLMAAAKAGAFQVVIVEALDRLSRDQEDLAGLYKRLSFAGIEIRCVHDGKADAIKVGLKGLIGQIYLEDLAHKTRRGLAGKIRVGLSAGGCAYGYRPVPGKPGELAINEEQANVIRSIFERYASGASPRAIAYDLNARKVRPPRGTHWNASTLNGNPARGYGILSNPLYIGRLVWNRVRMVKDPDTGRRLSRVNPSDQWQYADVPHLAIVSPDLWARVQEMRAAVSQSASRPGTKRPKHLLSGLIRCGACGAGMTSIGRDKRGFIRIQCARHIESGGDIIFPVPKKQPWRHQSAATASRAED